MNYIKSRITGGNIFEFFNTLFILFTIIFIIVKTIKYSIENARVLTTSLFFIFFFFLIIISFIINYLKKFRYVIIQENKLKYFSLFVPFGKSLDLNNYIGKIIKTDQDRIGYYKVIYLVDKNRRIVFKIVGRYYKNFDDMNNAIFLKKISFSLTIWQYFALMFFERTRIKVTTHVTKSRAISQAN